MSRSILGRAAVAGLMAALSLSSAPSRAGTSFQDTSLAEVSTGPFSSQQVTNHCVLIVLAYDCDNVPTSASSIGLGRSAQSSTDGRGGSSLHIEQFAPGATSNNAMTVETGLYTQGLGDPPFGDVVHVQAFLPQIHLSGLFFGPGITMRYVVAISTEDDPIATGGPPPFDLWFTEGTITTDADGNKTLTTAGADIGAALDPTTGDLLLENIFIDIALGLDTTPGHTVSLLKHLEFENPLGSSLEFAILSMVDPFHADAGGEQALLDAITFETTAAAAVPVGPVGPVVLGLSALWIARRSRRA